MHADILYFIGGLGLFLLGMVILTEGLKEIAGKAMRHMLANFTSTPLSGAATGAFTTAIIQSSSATTVTAVGFVAADLLTFPQSLGIIFGANIGTTITGWLVALLGFKLQLAKLVLPLLFFGVLLRLFGKNKLRSIGWAMAGFSLLFVGIENMQQGMAQFEGVLTPASFPDNTFIGRIQLVFIGILITLITQSSSAGIATALVALGTGTISFSQAAAMVIGMDIGTTFTTALATIGGSTASRQTGFAHVIYNIMTGIMAFIILVPFSTFANSMLTSGTGNPQLLLVAFHTLFNTVGVILVLPFTSAFSRLIMRLVPEQETTSLLTHLDKHLLKHPDSAIDAAITTLKQISTSLNLIIIQQLTAPNEKPNPKTPSLKMIDQALGETRHFVENIRTDPDQQHSYQRHLATLHALDHLMRLQHRCTQKNRRKTLHTAPRLQWLASIMVKVLCAMADKPNKLLENDLNRLQSILRRYHTKYRGNVIETAVLQKITTQQAIDKLDSIRWLYRMSYHLWRIEHHLSWAREMGQHPGTHRRTVQLDKVNSRTG